MGNNRAKELLKKYQEGKCTPEEAALLESWYILESKKEDTEHVEPDYELIKNKIYSQLPKPAKISRLNIWTKISAAAAVFLIISMGIYRLTLPHKTEQLAQSKTRNFAPGENKAILTLANGKKITLNTVQNGRIAQQGEVVISKSDSGQLVYASAGTQEQSSSAAVTYNTITIPRGGQYAITLADGTHVLLNSASSLTYPVAFTGSNRQVTLTGEGYFEVKHDGLHPFMVKTRDMNIRDIGTEFNVSAYPDDEKARTTLVQGAAEVSKAGLHRIIKPGDQAFYDDHTDQFKITQPDLEEIVAWKNGEFKFGGAKITNIMKQISRWYDVEIEYQGSISALEFEGTISRKKDASQLLDILEATQQVHFTVNGKKIIVIAGPAK